jgi:RNA polymerase sigma-70 factor (ECF subfamily)
MGSEGGLWQTLQRNQHCDDLSLAKRAAADEPLARRALLDRYIPLVYSVCRRVGVSAQDADDVCQNAVIKILQQLSRYRGEAKLSTWIYTLARRTALDHFRAPNQREVAVDWADATQSTLLPSIHDHHDERRDADKLTQLLDQISEPTRTIVLRFYLADDSVSEIANDLKLPEGTIKTHLFRARERLRAQLGVVL